MACAKIPDLILLEMLLPELSGPEVFQELKNNRLTAHIPVIVLSGLTQKNETKRKKAVAAAYLEKSKLDWIDTLSLFFTSWSERWRV